MTPKNTEWLRFRKYTRIYLKTCDLLDITPDLPFIDLWSFFEIGWEPDALASLILSNRE